VSMLHLLRHNIVFWSARFAPVAGLTARVRPQGGACLSSGRLLVSDTKDEALWRGDPLVLRRRAPGEQDHVKCDDYYQRVCC